jgi:hypothetical protein
MEAPRTSRGGPLRPAVHIVVALLACSCAVNLGFEKRDGWQDADAPDETDVDVPVDVDATDPDAADPDAGDPGEEDPGEEEPASVCGNGTVEDGEDCDGDAPRACTTTCGSEGTEQCIDCAWVCVPPPEVCNDVDDDCDDLTDESGLVTVAAAPVRITDHAGVSADPAIAWSGSRYGLVWIDDRGGKPDFYRAVVAPDGTPTAAEALLYTAATRAGDPDLVWWLGNFDVAATDAESGGTTDVVFFKMDGAGGFVGPIRIVRNEATDILDAP